MEKRGKLKHIWHMLRKSTIAIGILLAAWFIFRVGTRPDRILYPCQRTILTQAQTYVSNAATPLIGGLLIGLRNFWSKIITKRNIIVGALILVAFAGGILLSDNFKEPQKINVPQYISSLRNSDSGNLITGMSVKENYPHRVVSVHNSDASSWTFYSCTSGTCAPYYGNFVDQSVVDNMIDRGLMELTETSTIEEAWGEILPDYLAGEKIAIKVNFNDAITGGGIYGYGDNDVLVDALPQPINSIVRGLTSFGVQESDIWIFDCSRYITDRFRAKISNDFPGVYYYDRAIGGGTPTGPGASNIIQATYDSTDPSANIDFTLSGYSSTSHKICDVLVNADYLINMPIFKRHGGSEISLSFKNHLGSINGFTSGGHSMHSYFYTPNRGGTYFSTTQNPLVDINLNTNIKDKTVLIVGDGIYGTWPHNNIGPYQWVSFGTDSPNILFFSVDPVAIDSVMYDYLLRENTARGTYIHPDAGAYLQIAENNGIGVFEHWNNDLDRTYLNIDYIELEMDGMQTCAGQLGFYCTANQICSGAWLDASDTPKCCNVECTDPLPQPNCSEQGGFICSGSQICEGSWLNSSDSLYCCDVACTTLSFPPTVYVATDGSDITGDGSYENPWGSISYAVNQIPPEGNVTVLVKDGIYEGKNDIISKYFQNWVTIKAENPYKAVLSNYVDIGDWSAALKIAGTPGDANIRIEGFEFTNEYTGHTCLTRATVFLLLFSNMSNITLANNIIHGNNAPGTCNELLKINRLGGGFPKNILIQGNIFYDAAPIEGSDLLDAMMAGELNVTDNIFFNRNTNHASQSFITIKYQIDPSNPDAPAVIRSPRYVVNRNIFLNWDGKTDQAFIQFGEDDGTQVMVSDSIIENNLFIGNSPNQMRGPIQLKGTKNITIRANTIVGNYENSLHGGHFETVGSNPPTTGVSVFNNIFSDPTGTMNNYLFTTTGAMSPGDWVIDNNLFWNNLNSLPNSGYLNAYEDINRVEGDPLLETDQSGIVLPVWNSFSGAFDSGSATIREEFERLVNTYGALQSGSPAIGRADPLNMPVEDILGNARDSTPDIGAFEYIGGLGSCDDGTCDEGDNCPLLNNTCTADICYEPVCTNGCQQNAVAYGQKDEGCSGNNYCDGAGVCVACKTDIESNCDGIIDNTELFACIGKWYNNLFSISNLMECIKYWKRGYI